MSPLYHVTTQQEVAIYKIGKGLSQDAQFVNTWVFPFFRINTNKLLANLCYFAILQQMKTVCGLDQ